MIRSITQKKPEKEIERLLNGFNRIFIIGCGTCVTLTRTGGEPEVRAMQDELSEKGKMVTGQTVVPVACDNLTREFLGDFGEQIDQAVALLSDPKDPHRSVHESRKCLKRVRALLRLARPALQPETFRSENRRFRDIARALSAARDSQAMLESLAKLEAQPRLEVILTASLPGVQVPSSCTPSPSASTRRAPSAAPSRA